jgi:hypothetical protein
MILAAGRAPLRRAKHLPRGLVDQLAEPLIGPVRTHRTLTPREFGRGPAEPEGMALAAVLEIGLVIERGTRRISAVALVTSCTDRSASTA